MSSIKPLEVLYITPGGISGRGGMGRMAVYLTLSFAKNPELRIRVLDSYGPGPFWKMPFYFFRCASDLLSACLRGHVQVVHIHMSFGGSALRKLALLRLAAMFGVPSVLHLHGSEFAQFYQRLSPRTARALVASMNRAAKIIVIGRYWQDYLINTLAIDPARIAIIHNGVPLPAQRLRSDRTGCRIVYLGALGQRKGTADLLTALASPALTSLDWQADIAGNGDVAMYQTLATTLGLAHRVTLPGWVSAETAQSLLAAGDILVLPSYAEGLPVAVLEAMAAGLAVITTPVGAIPDLVLDGETGFLVNAGDIDALTDRLVRLVADPALRQSLGAEGRRRIEASFTIEAAAANIAKLYQEVAKTPIAH